MSLKTSRIYKYPLNVKCYGKHIEANKRNGYFRFDNHVYFLRVETSYECHHVKFLNLLNLTISIFVIAKIIKMINLVTGYVMGLSFFFR